MRVLVKEVNLELGNATLEGEGLSGCSAFITRCSAFWEERVIRRRRHKGRGRELEFSRTYHSRAFTLSGHQVISIQTNTVTIC